MLHPALVDGAFQGDLAGRDPDRDVAGVQIVVVGQALVDVFGETLVGAAVVLRSDAAIASGAGIALQNLIFGAFITVIVDFVSGKSDPDDFLDEAGELA